MSALLSEADLNDFISPGLACIKPTETKKINDENPEEIQVGKEPNELEKVSITLQDCLACAGCITSSEEILLSRQSHTVFMESWQKLSQEMVLAVSISPQSRLSLANYYSLSLAESDVCLMNFFKQYFHCKYFVGTQIGRNITINRTNELLKAMKRNGQLDGKPFISAVCPGFVLYAEKTKPDLVPHMLDIKSPQQITGSLLKQSAHESEKIYHLSIMPCFDKKLEASRPDGENEVDCVITPKELVKMMEELGVNYHDFATGDTDILSTMSPEGWDPVLHWTSNEGSSSGGFAYQYVLACQASHPHSDLLTLEGKNADVREYRLVDRATSDTIASASELYGFRNIQNMVRRLTANPGKRNVRVLKKRQGRSSNIAATPDRHNPLTAEPYTCDFIEVMACPGGCINGGGLLNSHVTGESARKRGTIDKLNRMYHAELSNVDPAILGRKLDEHSKSGSSAYVYQFNPVHTVPDDNIVSVGNTW